MYLKLAVLFVILSFHGHVAMASDPDPIQDFCIPNPKFHSIRPASFTTLQCKNVTEITTDDFVFSGMKEAGNFSETGIATIPVNPSLFPGLNTLGMSFARADLKAGSVNPPHFHPRATEIAFVVQGSVYSGFVDSTNRVFARVLEEGEVMVYPRGLLHFQMNVGKRPATIFGSFNSQNPGMQKIPSAIFGSGIDEQLLEKAFGLSPKQIGMMKRRFDPKSTVRLVVKLHCNPGVAENLILHDSESKEAVERCRAAMRLAQPHLHPFAKGEQSLHCLEMDIADP